MLNKSDLLVVIPAFNESETINSVISDLLSLSFNILVIDDGSTDGTGEIASNLGIEVITNTNNSGYESSINQGFEFALNNKYKFLATIDADDQFNPSDLDLFFSLIQEQVIDLIIGIRNTKNRLTENLLCTYGRTRFNIEDPLCGLKLYNLRSISTLLPFDTKGLAGMELIFKTADINLKIEQVEIRMRKRSGKSRYGHSIIGEFKLFKILLKSIYYFGLSKRKN